MEGVVYKNIPLQGEKNATLLNIASAPINLDLDSNKTEKCFLSVNYAFSLSRKVWAEELPSSVTCYETLFVLVFL